MWFLLPTFLEQLCSISPAVFLGLCSTNQSWLAHGIAELERQYHVRGRKEIRVSFSRNACWKGSHEKIIPIHHSCPELKVTFYCMNTCLHSPSKCSWQVIQCKGLTRKEKTIFCKVGLSHVLVGDSITHLPWEGYRKYKVAQLDCFVRTMYQLRLILPYLSQFNLLVVWVTLCVFTFSIIRGCFSSSVSHLDINCPAELSWGCSPAAPNLGKFGSKPAKSPKPRATKCMVPGICKYFNNLEESWGKIRTLLWIIMPATVHTHREIYLPKVDIQPLDI